MDSTNVRSAPRVIGGAALAGDGARFFGDGTKRFGVSALFGAAALLGALLVSPLPATAAPTVTGEACAGDDGVSVVVDFSDLGGDVVLGCAPGAPENGRAALEAAGFTPEDSMPGMVCAINSLPDPCPEEFDGNFWSYWSSDGGDWEMWMVGLDEAVPAPGSIEGWRYFDGSEGPSVVPSEIAGSADGAGDDDGADDADGSDDADDSTPAPSATDDGGDLGESAKLPVWAAAVIGLALIGAIVAMIVRNKRQ